MERIFGPGQKLCMKDEAWQKEEDIENFPGKPCNNYEYEGLCKHTNNIGFHCEGCGEQRA